MKKYINQIICGDCIDVLSKAKEPFADLIFADPPFNIGYKYDKYDDRVQRGKYIAWSRRWMTACCNALKPHGSFYIAIGDDYVAYIRRLGDRLRLHLRNWIIWHYTFGQQTKDKFARSHTHILYFVKNRDEFTFNSPDVRIISDRQKKYNDKRAKAEGKMPDDVWDEYPRVCGTFEERTAHPCQMPESLLARVIRASSSVGDLVLDPFNGSGTTAVVAKKLKRSFTGIDISEEYVKQTKLRLNDSGDSPVEGEDNAWTVHLDSELKWLYHENKIPSEQLSENPQLLALFTTKFNERIGNEKNVFQPQEVIRHLIRIRKSGKLGPLGKISTVTIDRR
jgi:DNA modification methylase